MPDKLLPMRRRDFVNLLAAIPAGGTIFGDALLIVAQEEKKITRDMVIQAEELAGLRFTDAQREMITPTLQNYLQNIRKIREMQIPPEVAPAMIFISDTQGVWKLNPKKRTES